MRPVSGNGKLTADQRRNRARATIAIRIIAALLALGVAANLVAGIRAGYIRLGLSDRRGPGGDYLTLDTPIGMALGVLILEIVTVFFALVAISPRGAMRPRVLLSSLAAVALVSALLHVFFE